MTRHGPGSSSGEYIPTARMCSLRPEPYKKRLKLFLLESGFFKSDQRLHVGYDNEGRRITSNLKLVYAGFLRLRVWTRKQTPTYHLTHGGFGTPRMSRRDPTPYGGSDGASVRVSSSRTRGENRGGNSRGPGL